MKIVIVKASSLAERDRMWVTRSDGSSSQVPINVAHDLPHLAVESALNMEHGFWGLIDSGAFAAEIQASAARDPKRAKEGRIGVLAARPHQSPVGHDPVLAQYSEELVAAKAVTNVFRAWGMAAAPAANVKAHLDDLAEDNRSVAMVLDRLTDEEVAKVFALQDELWRRWRALEPGETLRLAWPYSGE